MRPAPRRLLRLVLCAALLGLGAQAPQPEAAPPEAEPATLAYRTEIAPSGDAALDAALAAASRLLALQERAPTDAAGLVARAEAEPERLRQAFESEGYWAGTARIALDPVALANRTADAPPATIRIAVEPGPRYRFRHLDAVAQPAEAAPAVAALTLAAAPGDPARAAAVLAAEAALLAALARAGHPLASLPGREVTVDHDAQAMDVRFLVAPGPVAAFAAPEISGETRVSPDFLRRFAGARLATGETYAPDRVERARAALAGLGPFGQVRALPGTALDAAGRLPLTFEVTDRKPRAIGFNAAYETNFGLALRAFWEHRNLFGNAERLRIEGEASRIGSDGDRMNYRLGATLRDPFAFGRDIAVTYSTAILRERLDSYDRDAVQASVIAERRLSPRLVLLTGPVAEAGKSGPSGGALRSYQLIGWRIQARWDSTDSPFEPTRGIRALATLTPSYAFAERAVFAAARIDASTYIAFDEARRSILALRAAAGQLIGLGAESVPFPQRFFAGGGGSVRGYTFQSIGPRDARSRPLGGSTVTEVSAEFRQRIGESFGAVIFADGGAVTRGGGDSALRLGVGVGARYYTPLGPMRADIAVPLVKEKGNSGYGLYLGIGQAF